MKFYALNCMIWHNNMYYQHDKTNLKLMQQIPLTVEPGCSLLGTQGVTNRIFIPLCSKIWKDVITLFHATLPSLFGAQGVTNAILITSNSKYFKNDVTLIHVTLTSLFEVQGVTNEILITSCSKFYRMMNPTSCDFILTLC